jgi:hypothetical protein
MSVAIKYAGPTIDPSVPFEVRRHLQLMYEKLGNHTQAFALQQSKIDALKAGASTTNMLETVNAVSGGGTTSTIGSVNNQIGVTSYSTISGDDGSLILFSDASPIAVTLNSQTPPWSCIISNQGVSGSGTVNLTPIDGTINGLASLSIIPNYCALVAFDGSNWWAVSFTGLLPQTFAKIAHEWIDSYNESTGLFTASQPAFTDISGIASYSQIPVFPYVAKTANYTLGLLDYQIECTANSFTLTLPTSVGVAGRVYSMKNSGTGTITVATTSSQTIDGSTTQTLTQWDNLQVMSNGTGWVVI